MKLLIKHLIIPIFAIRLIQPFYRLLHRLSLVEMNIGPVGEISTSGEVRLIKRIMHLAPEAAVLFDVGANVGEFSIRLAQAGSAPVKIYAFEPSPSIHARLSNAIRTHSTNTRRIIPILEGLSDQITSSTLSITAGFEGNASLRQRDQIQLSQSAITERISLNTIDNFCTQNCIGRIFFLKLDVEGEEFACLRGASNLFAGGCIDYIQFEFGGCNIQSRVFLKDFWDLLSPAYDIYRVVQNGLFPEKKYHELLEIFTTTNFLAVRRGLPVPS